jgi:hypothetical protein
VDSAGNLYVADSNGGRISEGTLIYPWPTMGSGRTHAQISWSAVYQGWELQAQTNWPSTRLGLYLVPGDRLNDEHAIVHPC